LYIFNLFLLLLVFVPGIGSNIKGASRWLSFGSLVVQPSETMKVINLIYLATWLEKKQPLTKFLTVLGIPTLLILLEPDFGTATIVFMSGLALYFLSGAPIKKIISILTMSLVVGLGFIFTSDYRRDRLLAFLNPLKDPLGTSYHINQIMLALAAGGWWGVGIGNSRQKHSFLPEAPTDSIFAVIAEEVGFVGSLVLIFFLLYLIFLLFRISQSCSDRYGQLLAGAIAFWLGWQSLLNLAAMVALVPLTGIPLPFISYGGSSLIVNLAAVGIIMNIARSS
jgi:cell division protein FtsW